MSSKATYLLEMNRFKRGDFLAQSGKMSASCHAQIFKNIPEGIYFFGQAPCSGSRKSARDFPLIVSPGRRTAAAIHILPDASPPSFLMIE
jgi:hypothetical protein